MKLHFNINLSKKQKEIYDTIHDPLIQQVVAVMSRQIGKTTIATILMIEYLVKIPNGSVFYISPDYGVGKKVFREIATLLENTGLIKSKNNSDLTITITNGSILKFFTAKNASAFRGNTCKSLLVIDEAAFFPEQTPDGQLIWSAIIKPACKVYKPKILLISTPCGKNGFFYEEYLKGCSNTGFNYIKTITATIYDDNLVTSEEIEEIKAGIPKLAWEQEFMVKFLDSSLTVFNGYEEQFTNDKHLTKFELGTNPVWIGVDLSTQGDDNTIVTLIGESNILTQYKIDGELDVKYRRIADIIESVKNLGCCYIEENGIGVPIINEIKKLVKRNRGLIRPFTTTNKSKTEDVGRLCLMISNKDIWFDAENTDLFSEMGTFIYRINKNTKTITYAAKDGYHDDRVMSLLLAVRAKEEHSAFSYKKDVNFVKARFKEFS